MKNLRRRIEKAEKKLSLGKEHITITVTQFGGKLPPDHTEGNITFHYVMYDKKTKQ